MTPLAGKLAALQQDVQGVVKSEGDRKATAERIVLSLELANLKRAIDRGKGYAAELAQARKLAGSSVDLAPLAALRRHEACRRSPSCGRTSRRSPSRSSTRRRSRPTARSSTGCSPAPSRSCACARSSHSADDKSVEAVVARMETALNEDRLADVLQEAKTLPPPAQDAAHDFLAKVEARDAVDRALATRRSAAQGFARAPRRAAPTARPQE